MVGGFGLLFDLYFVLLLWLGAHGRQVIICCSGGTVVVVVIEVLVVIILLFALFYAFVFVIVHIIGICCGCGSCCD